MHINVVVLFGRRIITQSEPAIYPGFALPGQSANDKTYSYIGILSVVLWQNTELCVTAEALLNEVNSCSIQLLSLTVNVCSTCYLAFSRPMLLSMA